MWRLILKVVLAVSGRPEVRAWAQRKARKAVERIRNRAESQTAKIADAAGLDPAPKPKLSRLIRTEKDVLKPGQTVIVEGAPFRIVRLISSSARETVYEAVEA